MLPSNNSPWGLICIIDLLGGGLFQGLLIREFGDLGLDLDYDLNLNYSVFHKEISREHE